MNWFDQGYLCIRKTDFGQGVFSQIDYEIKENEQEEVSMGALFGTLVCLKNQISREENEYIYAINEDYGFDPKSNWIGKINHAGPNSDKLNARVCAKDMQLYLTKSLKKGDQIFTDYGAEYWIYQITGIELGNEWKNKADLNFFHKLYQHTDDYSPYLALRSEIDRLKGNKKSIIQLLKQTYKSLNR